ncbi:hypothetical protein P280DRAFT_491706 [Massarina eburnea CBS 473.64]|uniref:DUF6594 domain-containing protein n=1 Tax=Massarina eburnea CBS 473.64 TaxID=1395130 RepID=A0A6A6RT98_9PLEO|nr:hypothetical protein P280DRAFT_491706 [Massarina eburnea CBS 473.64]
MLCATGVRLVFQRGSDRVIGYPKLAAQMELQPELAIFRRFGALNAQNILYFQAELVWLEKCLQARQKADSISQEGERHQYALNWYWLDKSRDGKDAEQLELVLRIRKVLAKYNKTLIRQHEILKISEPEKGDLGRLQEFLQNPEMGPLALKGPDASLWGSVHRRESYESDLIALRSRLKEDPFSSWVAEKAVESLLRWGCARFGKHNPHGIIGYRDAAILRVTFWITSIVASLVPITSIVVLYSVKSMPARLAVIAAFSVLVSMCLIAFTNAKKAEVFAIIAAYVCVSL